MSNYSDSIVIPFFQKKIAELQNLMLILEANLLVDQQRTKDISSESASLANEGISKNISSLKKDLVEQSLRLQDSLSLNTVLTQRIEELKKIIERQEKNMISMDSEIKNLTKKKKSKDNVLDGSTF